MRNRTFSRNEFKRDKSPTVWPAKIERARYGMQSPHRYLQAPAEQLSKSELRQLLSQAVKDTK